MDTMWTCADKMWTDADDKYRQDQYLLHAKSNGMVQYRTVRRQSGEQAQYFEAIHLTRLKLIFWALQTTVDKRCRQMRTVSNNEEKCRQTREKCGQTADLPE